VSFFPFKIPLLFKLLSLSLSLSLSLTLSLSLSLLNEQAKEFSKTTYRKTTYRLREVADKFEAWSRRQK